MILCVTGVTVLPENQMEDGASATAAGEGREAPSVVGLLVGAILTNSVAEALSSRATIKMILGHVLSIYVIHHGVFLYMYTFITIT